MKRILMFTALFISLHVLAQDTTMSSLTKDLDSKGNNERAAVKIFNSERLINANTTEIVRKGKMDFKITHNFGDIAGNSGGIKNFFGLDASTDVRIGFHIGLSNRLNLNISHSKGDEQTFRGDSIVRDFLVRKLYEVALKYQILRQYEHDPSHPIALTLFVNTAISTMSAAKTGAVIVPDKPNSFENFSDRMSEVFQVIISKKINKVSIQLNPTLVHYNYVPSYSDNNTFALGGAVRLPVSNAMAIIVDYFHPFLSDTWKKNYTSLQGVKFYDALGVGLEIITAGHVFHMNFTNTTGILENQFIPYTTSSWGKGQFRWGFNVSRTFVLWREKGK
jgi:Membrane bound beta barrel domain (DUF5777)